VTAENKKKTLDTPQKGKRTKKPNAAASKTQTASKRSTAKTGEQARKQTQKTNKSTPKKQTRKKKAPTLPVKITCLGGLNEIGKNITLVEYEEDAFLIDCGMAFPESDMLGVDIVLPDFSHILKFLDIFFLINCNNRLPTPTFSL